MNSGDLTGDKQLYHALRHLSRPALAEEMARFDRAAAPERLRTVALVRAVGVVYSESGTAAEKDGVRLWLRGLLRDPAEKIRRYAMAALPKIGAGPADEDELLALLRSTPAEREQKFIAQTLEKVGGRATLEQLASNSSAPLRQLEQKVKASVARDLSPSALRMDSPLAGVSGLRIHLRGRRGLEQIVGAEAEEHAHRHKLFRVADVRSELVAITPLAAFNLAELYKLRCFGTLNFVLGSVRPAGEVELIGALAAVITSPLARRILATFTSGSIRYRLAFMGKGHQRSVVRRLANHVYGLCPALLNDPRQARWEIDIYPWQGGYSVELRPKLTPDPRYAYRQDDVPAASHPPLAACMARVAGRVDPDIVWDPFCGSGLELVERALLGGVRQIHGSDRSAEAIAIAGRNFVAAAIASVTPRFTCCDFRDFARITGLGPQSVTLVITNPPMGNRVPIPDLRQLMVDLFRVAALVLKPGGRLVFANPLRLDSPEPSLILQSRQVFDLGGFDCRLEKYQKVHRR